MSVIFIMQMLDAYRLFFCFSPPLYESEAISWIISSIITPISLPLKNYFGDWSITFPSSAVSFLYKLCSLHFSWSFAKSSEILHMHGAQKLCFILFSKLSFELVFFLSLHLCLQRCLFPPSVNVNTFYFETDQFTSLWKSIPIMW